MKKTTDKTVKSAGVKKPVQPPAKPAAPVAPPRTLVKIKLPAKDKEELRDNLHALRARLSGQMTALRQDSLTREQADNTIEDGTDAFERQVSLNLVSSEHDEIVAIDDAIQRLELGTYGACEECFKAIEKARLKALPFVRLCVKCQSESEKGKTKFRPLSPDTTM